MIGISRNLYVQIFKSFQTPFPAQIDIFFHLLLGELRISAKNFTFYWFWLGKIHHNGLSGMYFGFEVCQIQWHLSQISTISSFWKIKISSKNFTLCWFWLGKMHQNGLSGMYLGFEVCQIQWHRFQVSMISGSWKIKNFRQKLSHFVDFDWKKCIKMAWGVHIKGLRCAKSNGTCFKYLCNKQFLRNQNFRQKFHILLNLTAEKWIKMAWVALI